MSTRISFLELVLKRLQGETQLDQRIYVFPNLRSRNTAYRIFASLQKRSSFAPKCLTIEELMSETAQLRSASAEEQLLSLFEVYQSCVGKSLNFYEFSPMGTQLLQDFNEFDQSLIDASKLFLELKQIGELDAKFAENQRSELIQKHLNRVELVSKVYSAYTHSLRQRGLGYEGLIYRVAAERVHDYALSQKMPHVFIGFNAFSKSEQTVTEALLKGHEKAAIFWDIDWSLVQEDHHEASHFIRMYRKKWGFLERQSIPSVLKENNELLTTDRPIVVYDCPGLIAQCQAMAEILKEIDSYEDTAVVLADEGLLPAVIAHLPNCPEKGAVNITTGEALSYTPTYGLFRRLVRILRLSQRQQNRVSRRELHPLLEHPLIASDLLNTRWASQSYQIDLSDKATPSFLRPFEKLSEGADRIQDFLNQLPTPEAKVFQTAVDQALSLQLERLPQDSSLETLEELIIRQLKGEYYTYKGESTTGLQIMGILETRNQTFKRVILLSLNEGIIPKGKSASSVVPHEMKRAFEMPTYKEKDAIYTYYFYRLIQKAEEVYLTYNNQPGSFDTKEKSRLIYQLEMHPQLRKSIIYRSVHYNLSSNTLEVESHRNCNDHPNEVPLNKDGSFMESLRSLCARGLSPSSLSAYLSDHRKFYEGYILEMESYQEEQVQMAHNTFGSIIHHSLDLLYSDVLSKALTPDALHSVKARISNAMEQAYQLYAPHADLNYGWGYLVEKVIATYLKRCIEHDSKLSEHNSLELLYLEQKLQTKLETPWLSPYAISSIILKGTVDRIDCLNSQTRILDYKTGKVEARNLQLDSLDQVIHQEKTKAFQLLFYAYLLYRNPQTTRLFDTPLIAGIFEVKKQQFSPLKLGKNPMQITPEIVNEFEEILKKVILELFEQPFYCLECPK